MLKIDKRHRPNSDDNRKTNALMKEFQSSLSKLQKNKNIFCVLREEFDTFFIVGLCPKKLIILNTVFWRIFVTIFRLFLSYDLLVYLGHGQ